MSSRVLRCVLSSSIFVLLTAAAAATTHAQTTLEFGVDRPGADYYSFDLVTPDANTCRAVCENDSQCQAFSYVRPGIQGPRARCWLKSAAPNRVGSGCCISGARLPATLETSWDRPGGDYRVTSLPFGTPPESCMQRCLQDANCLAYTYVNAGVQAANPLCYLKNDVPAPVPSACCYSGTVPDR